MSSPTVHQQALSVVEGAYEEPQGPPRASMPRNDMPGVSRGTRVKGLCSGHIREARRSTAYLGITCYMHHCPSMSGPHRSESNLVAVVFALVDFVCARSD